MVLLNHRETKEIAEDARKGQPGNSARTRLARELFNGRCRTGESVPLSEIAARYQLDEDSVLKVFVEFQTLGMVTLSGRSSMIIHS